MNLPNTLAAIFAAKLIAEGKPVPAYVFSPCALCGQVERQGNLPGRIPGYLPHVVFHLECSAELVRYGCD